MDSPKMHAPASFLQGKLREHINVLNVEIVAIHILHINFIRSTIAIILYFNKVATSHS